MLKAILLCALLTTAVIVLGGLLFSRLLLPLQPDGIRSVLCAVGDGGDLEQPCRAYLFLRRLGVFRQPLLLVDFGLNEEGRALAERLAGLDPSIRLCGAEALSEAVAPEAEPD